VQLEIDAIHQAQRPEFSSSNSPESRRATWSELRNARGHKAFVEFIVTIHAGSALPGHSTLECLSGAGRNARPLSVLLYHAIASAESAQDQPTLSRAASDL